MGYLVVAHIMKNMPDLARLSELPTSMDWSLHQDDGVGAFYLDTFKAGRKQDWPFTSMPPTKEIPLDFAPDLEPLAAIYRVLEKSQLAHSFPRGFLNLGLAISKALLQPVCSFCSDDDGLDFAFISDSGRLLRLHCECNDLDIVYEDGEMTVQPLLLEDDEFITDVSLFCDLPNNIHVQDRNVEHSPRLHRVASLEATRFLGLQEAPLGLGSFDGMESTPGKIASSSNMQTEEPKTAPKAKRPWWKVW